MRDDKIGYTPSAELISSGQRSARTRRNSNGTNDLGAPPPRSLGRRHLPSLGPVQASPKLPSLVIDPDLSSNGLLDCQANTDYCPRDGGISLDGVATQQIAINSITKPRRGNPNLCNPHGDRLKPPSFGAKGIAGVRADLFDGRITKQQFTAMSLSQIMKKYFVSRTHAIRIRDYVKLYGVHGKHRSCFGERRPLPTVAGPAPGGPKPLK
jgi:hypothetical protein